MRVSWTLRVLAYTFWCENTVQDTVLLRLQCDLSAWRDRYRYNPEHSCPRYAHRTVDWDYVRDLTANVAAVHRGQRCAVVAPSQISSHLHQQRLRIRCEVGQI